MLETIFQYFLQTQCQYTIPSALFRLLVSNYLQFFFPSLAINGSKNYLYDIYLIFAYSFHNLSCYVFFILILVSLQNHLSIEHF